MVLLGGQARTDVAGHAVAGRVARYSGRPRPDPPPPRANFEKERSVSISCAVSPRHQLGGIQRGLGRVHTAGSQRESQGRREWWTRIAG